MVGNTLTINASTKSDTRYVVRIPGSLHDEFGQTLGASKLESFDVGEATPALMAFPHSLTTTDPSAKQPSVLVTSVGNPTLKVDVYATDRRGGSTTRTFLENWGYKDGSLSSWQHLSSTTLTVDGGGHELTESNIDLSGDLHGAPGHLLVVVSPTRQYPSNTELYYENRPTITWVQTTAIGCRRPATNDQLIAWATDLHDGAPLSGVRVQIAGATDSQTTGATASCASGSCAPVPHGDEGRRCCVASGRRGVRMEAVEAQRFGNGVLVPGPGIYRPGETVHVKGWFRRVRVASDSAISPLGTAQTARCRRRTTRSGTRSATAPSI